MAKDLTLAVTRLDPTTGEVIAVSDPAPVPGSEGVFTLTLNGHDVGELRVFTDGSGRPSLALGQFDRRSNDWRAQPIITRRGGWIEQDVDGFHPVFDGRRFPGVNSFSTEAEAQIALTTIEAVKG